MADLNFDGTGSGSIWSTVISVGLLILAIKFPVLFLLNGLIGLGFGIYFLVSSYINLAKDNLNETEKVFFNLINFMGWITTILGGASMLVFFFLKKKKSV